MKRLILSVAASISLASSFSANTRTTTCTGIARSKQEHTTRTEENLSVFTLHGHSHGHGHINTNNDNDSMATGTQLSRRGMMENAFKSASILAFTLTVGPKPSFAGLVQFPCDYDLRNTYHFMRAGESLLENQNLLSTNPLFMTNRDDALSPLGVEQVCTAMNEMMLNDINPSVVKYSLAAKSIDTANLVANEMQVGRNRLIPEYTFMDPRGVGAWNMHPLSATEEAIWAMDEDEAGKEGKGGRPPATDDGTADETLFDQMIRLRQLMSVLETQFSGDEVLLIFGDGTSPALLSALMAGLPLNKVHELNFQPGEIRYDITRDRVLLSYSSVSEPATAEKFKSEEYKAMIDRGRKTLKELRDEENKPIIEDLASTRPVAVVKEALPSKNNGAAQQSAPDLVGTFPFMALGTTAAIVSSSSAAQNEEGETDEDGEQIMLLEQHHQNQLNSKVVDIIPLSPELQRMENLVTSAPFDIPEITMTKKEKITIAAEAMEDYMNRDDGGEDWLTQIASIADEE